MPKQFIRPVLAIMAVSMLLWIAFWIVFSYSKRKKGIRISFETEVTYFLFYVYIVGVFSLTIIPLPFERFRLADQTGINFIPLVHTVKAFLEMISPHKTISEHSFQNVIGNIILFIPLGIFLPLLSVQLRSFNKVMILACVCSMCIELTQLFLGIFSVYRNVDIDDVILNTLGAVIGYGMVKVLYFRKVNV